MWRQITWCDLIYLRSSPLPTRAVRVPPERGRRAPLGELAGAVFPHIAVDVPPDEGGVPQGTQRTLTPLHSPFCHSHLPGTSYSSNINQTGTNFNVLWKTTRLELEFHSHDHWPKSPNSKRLNVWNCDSTHSWVVSGHVTQFLQLRFFRGPAQPPNCSPTH